MWIPVTVAAAGFQTARTALQHRLRALLSVSGAGFVRYVYGAPLSRSGGAGRLAVGVTWPHDRTGASGRSSPAAASPRSWAPSASSARSTPATSPSAPCSPRPRWCRWRVFSLGAARRAAAPGAVGWAPLVCMVGVTLLATKGRGCRLRRCANRPRCTGWPRAVCSGSPPSASVAPRRRSATVRSVMRALVTLAVMNTIQTVVHGGYLLVREREQLRLSFVHWRSAVRWWVCSACAARPGWAHRARARERRQGAHARSGGTAVHLRRVALVAPRPPHAGRVRRPARWWPPACCS